MPEDEFFDAVETALERIEEDMQFRTKLKLQSQQSQISTNSSIHPTINQQIIDGGEPDGRHSNEFGTGAMAKTHTLWPEVILK